MCGCPRGLGTDGCNPVSLGAGPGGQVQQGTWGSSSAATYLNGPIGLGQSSGSNRHELRTKREDPGPGVRISPIFKVHISTVVFVRSKDEEGANPN